MSGNQIPTRLVHVDDKQLIESLRRWFEHSDEVAGQRAFQALQVRLVAPPELLRVLGSDDFDELRQDVLTKLLTEPPDGFRRARNPIAYARRALRNRALDRLRRRSTRTDARSLLAASATSDGTEASVVQRQLDAGQALRLAQKLSFVTRMAVLLTTRPACISAGDWSTLSAMHTPPPVRPTHALDREQASRLLYPAAVDETPAERTSRRNRFDQALRRGTNQLREAMMEDA